MNINFESIYIKLSHFVVKLSLIVSSFKYMKQVKILANNFIFVDNSCYAVVIVIFKIIWYCRSAININLCE
jgi:hypothetical protein